MKYVLTYGLLSGLIIIGVMLTGIVVADRESFFASMYFGFLVMFVAMAFMFVGVKRYRDVELGGVIRFWPAFLMGLGIAAVAALCYVLIWEIYLASTGYRFMDDYLAGMAGDYRAAGMSEAQVAEKMGEYAWMRDNYPNPLIRIPLTFIEIFPVGLLVALVSAALLRNPRLLPATR